MKQENIPTNQGLKHEDARVRSVAIKDLTSSELSSRLELLQKHFQDESNVQVKYEARKGINELQALLQREIPVSSLNRQTQQQLQNDLQSKNEERTRKACQYILQHRLAEFLPETLLLEDEISDPFIKIVNIKLLLLDSNKNFDHLMEYLDDRDPRVIATAIEALEEVGNSKALAAISRFAEWPDNRVRANALKALHALGDDQAFVLLQHMIESRSSAYRDSAAFVIAALKIEKTIPLLQTLLQDQIESIRAKAYRGLKELALQGSVSARQILDEMRKTAPSKPAAPKILTAPPPLASSPPPLASSPPPPASRNSAPAPLLAKFPPASKAPAPAVSAQAVSTPAVSAQAVSTPAANSSSPSSAIDQALSAALHSDSTEIRVEALKGLTPEPPSLELIIERLSLEKDSKAQATALLALARARGNNESKQKILRQYLSSEDDRLRANAIEGLALISPKKGRQEFLPLLKDPHNRCVGNAVLALSDADEYRTQFFPFVSESLQSLSRSEQENANLTCIYCIGMLQDEAFLPILNFLLLNRRGRVHEKAQEVLNSWASVDKRAARVLENYHLSLQYQEEEKQAKHKKSLEEEELYFENFFECPYGTDLLTEFELGLKGREKEALHRLQKRQDNSAILLQIRLHQQLFQFSTCFSKLAGLKDSPAVFLEKQILSFLASEEPSKQWKLMSKQIQDRFNDKKEARRFKLSILQNLYERRLLKAARSALENFRREFPKDSRAIRLNEMIEKSLFEIQPFAWSTTVIIVHAISGFILMGTILAIIFTYFHHEMAALVWTGGSALILLLLLALHLKRVNSSLNLEPKCFTQVHPELLRIGHRGRLIQFKTSEIKIYHFEADTSLFSILRRNPCLPAKNYALGQDLISGWSVLAPLYGINTPEELIPDGEKMLAIEGISILRVYWGWFWSLMRFLLGINRS